jgi:hypothetical protein
LHALRRVEAISLDVLCRFANSKVFFHSLPSNVHDLKYGTEAPLQIPHPTVGRDRIDGEFAVFIMSQPYSNPVTAGNKLYVHDIHYRGLLLAVYHAVTLLLSLKFAKQCWTYPVLFSHIRIFLQSDVLYGYFI